MFLSLGLMAVPNIPKDVLDLDAQKPVTAKIDVHGNDALYQNRRKNAFAKQTAHGNEGLNIGLLKLQVITKPFDFSLAYWYLIYLDHHGDLPLIVIYFLYLEGNASITSITNDVEDVPGSLIEIEKRNAEKEAQKKVEGL